jgi:hypothetical protein
MLHSINLDVPSLGLLAEPQLPGTSRPDHRYVQELRALDKINDQITVHKYFNKHNFGL